MAEKLCGNISREFLKIFWRNFSWCCHWHTANHNLCPNLQWKCHWSIFWPNPLQNWMKIYCRCLSNILTQFCHWNTVNHDLHPNLQSKVFVTDLTNRFTTPITYFKPLFFLFINYEDGFMFIRCEPMNIIKVLKKHKVHRNSQEEAKMMNWGTERDDHNHMHLKGGFWSHLGPLKTTVDLSLW